MDNSIKKLIAKSILCIIKRMENGSKFKTAWTVKYKVSVGNSKPKEHVVHNVPGKCREEAANRVVDHFKKFMQTCLSHENYKISIISIKKKMRKLKIQQIRDNYASVCCGAKEIAENFMRLSDMYGKAIKNNNCREQTTFTFIGLPPDFAFVLENAINMYQKLKDAGIDLSGLPRNLTITINNLD